MKRCSIFILFCAAPLFGFGQSKAYRTNNAFDAAVSGASGQFSGALSWVHMHGIGKGQKRLKLGYGVRLTSFVGANKYYSTAPSKLTSTVQNLGTIFSETIDRNIDTISVATSITNSLNATINIQYTLSSRLDVGFNIDAIGFSFGPKKLFNVISSSFDASQTPIGLASPTRFNLLLTSDNDIGSLNSELFVRYWTSRTIGLRFGYTFLFSEYTTDRSLSFDNGRIMNDRYRYKAGMVMLGVTFQPFRQEIITK